MKINKGTTDCHNYSTGTWTTCWVSTGRRR